MKPVEKKKSSRTLLTVSVAVSCVLCFALGVLVPVAWQKNTENAELSKLEEVLNLLETRWYYADGSQEQNTSLIENAIVGMTTLEEDPHTSYFSVEEAKDYSSMLSGSNVGIGITYLESAEGGMLVSGVFLNSPAEKAGLKKGDEILQIADLVTSEHDSETLVEKIQSSQNESLDLLVLRDGEQLDMEIVPDTYSSSVQLDLEDEYGLITLTRFTETSGKDFQEAAARMSEAGLDTLILDLRDNGGGYVSAAQIIAAVLLPEGSVLMQEKDASGNIETIYVDEDTDQVAFEKIIVLQNENSASASEVLIGALQDQLGDVVTTVGTTTYGKGTEQTSTAFTDGSSIKYTIAEWLTPSGTSVNGTGLAADVETEAGSTYGSSYTFQEDETVQPDTVSVKAIPAQVYLQALGYGADRTDGYFSEASSEALAAFQADYGLEASGILDAESMDLLTKVYNAWILDHETQADLQLAQAVSLAKGS